MMIKKLSPKINIAIFIGIFCFTLISVAAQTVKIEPRVVIDKDKFKVKTVVVGDTGTAEKSVAVDAKVNISLCVSEGKLKINGWERSEIRAFVSGGTEVGFKIREKSRKNNNAVWVMVVGFDTTKKQNPNVSECLSGDDIEIDVPRGATVNIKNYESETNISSIAKLIIENASGDIYINNIERGVDATTYEGDVTIEKSSGAISLSSTTGNIVAFDLAPSDIGDILKAKTNSGAITLQNIEHRQLEINSHSGSMKFAGEFQNGGQYRFGTQNGTIGLLIPETSSCKILASYGFGAFSSQIPLQNVLKSTGSKTQSLTATMGGGDATLNLTTYSGAIRIKKASPVK
jgi:hypothetical protein